MTRIKAAIIALILIAIPLTMNHFNDYMTYQNYDVEVVDVISGMSSGKHSSLEFIAVYELEDGYRFDRNISAATSTQLKPGQEITLELRPFDVKQTTMENIVWSFGGVLANSAGFVAGAVFGLLAISRRFNNWMNS
ncbi:thioredoxin [Salmonella phage KM16]|uniref:thioredoxin n=1 Tax=Salmonella phage KM16 TaxID=2797303 RepID=UPI0024917481|nr:thioredoxin [Salmonella phage KM16]